jgi:ABC-2 type transport system permease protein
VVEVVWIWWRLVGARIRADWQYRTSFLLFAVGQALITLLDFLVIAVIFGQVPQLAGWTLPEVAFLYGLSSIGFAIATVLVSQVESVAPLIREGTFDRLLVRPLGPLVQLSAEFFALRRLGKLAQAVAVFVLAIAWLDLDWHAARIALTAVAIVSAAVIFGALFVMTSSTSFWTVDSVEVQSAFTYGGSLLTQYPLSILDEWLRRFVIYVLPLGFVAYLPALLIIGKPSPAGVPRGLGYASPAVAALMAFLARTVWSTAIRHYRSTGS